MFAADALSKGLGFFLVLVVMLSVISYLSFQVTADLVTKIFFACFAAGSLYFGFKLASPPNEKKMFG